MKKCITTCARIREADCEAREVTQDEEFCYDYISRLGRWAGVGAWARCPCCRRFIIAHGCVVDQHKVNAGLFSLFLGIKSPEYDCDGSGHVAIEYEREENEVASVATNVCKPSPLAKYKFDAFWEGVNRSLDEAREKGDVTHHLPWSATPAVFKKKTKRLPLGEPTTVVSPMGQACPEGENMITKDTKGVAIHFVPLDEDMHPGGCIEDNEVVLEILKESNDGNIFAWFCAKVWATYGGVSGEPVYLGGCSYESEADFKSSDSYDDMVDEAVANLAGRLSELRRLLAEVEP